MADSLAKLSVVDPQGQPNAVWHHFVDLDLGELRRGRDKMKVQLARYARQSLFGWDDRPVSELIYWHGLLAELVEGESQMQTAFEE